MDIKIWKIKLFRNFPQDRGPHSSDLKEVGIWVGKYKLSLVKW